jgi:hypothetical protein
MSTKFKPKKKESEPVVDDWEASDEEDALDRRRDLGSVRANKVVSATPAIAQRDAWEEEVGDQDQRTSTGSNVEVQHSRELWQEA